MVACGLTLRPVDIDNYYGVLMLRPTPDQQGFLWANGAALAEACMVPDQTAEAVYAGEDLIGMVVWGPYHPGYAFKEAPEPGSWAIAHLMIDAAFQGRGHGRALVEALIARLAEQPGCRRVVLDVDRGNHRALALYEKLGFRRFGTDHEGDPLLALDV